jgi:hypothetical protein
MWYSPTHIVMYHNMQMKDNPPPKVVGLKIIGSFEYEIMLQTYF